MNRPERAGGTEPPPIPPVPPGPWPNLAGRSKRELAVIFGSIVLPCVALPVVIVAVMLPKMEEPSRVTTCHSHLSELAQCYVDAARTDPRAAQRWSGPAMWLALRSGGASERCRQERLFFCPDDGSADVPSSQVEHAAWDDADLASPPREVCSYAGRDFANHPISQDDPGPHAIGACVHHRRGALVAYDDGDVRYLERDELGLTPDDDVVCGPESKSPLLRQLVGGN